MVRDWFFCLWKGLKYDSTWRFYGLPHIFTARRRGEISIGKNFIATSQIKNNSMGVIQPVVLKVFPGARMEIGDNVGISGSTLCASTKIQVGNDVLIGTGCLIADTDAHPINPDKRSDGTAALKAPVVIEDSVFIGARCIILKGVHIGKGSVIGAGSVIAKNIAEYAVAVGNPATIIGDSRSL